MSSGRLLQKQPNREKNRAWKNPCPVFRFKVYYNNPRTFLPVGIDSEFYWVDLLGRSIFSQMKQFGT